MFSLVHNLVTDFNQWKSAYNSMESARQAGGVVSSKVMQSEDNPNDVFILLEWGDSKTARNYFASDALKEAMRAGGVVGTPDIWFVTSV